MAVTAAVVCSWCSVGWYVLADSIATASAPATMVHHSGTLLWNTLSHLHILVMSHMPASIILPRYGQFCTQLLCHRNYLASIFDWPLSSFPTMAMTQVSMMSDPRKAHNNHSTLSIHIKINIDTKGCYHLNRISKHY